MSDAVIAATARTPIGRALLEGKRRRVRCVVTMCVGGGGGGADLSSGVCGRKTSSIAHSHRGS
jgi:hypothetical protein